MPSASWAFVNDFRFVLPANECGWTLGQAAVGVVQDWSHAHMRPLLIEKSLILYCGVNNVCHEYMLEGQSMPTTDVFKDLGELRSSYHYYIELVALLFASCRWLAGMIRRVFQLRDAYLLRTALEYTSSPVIYAFPAWSFVFQYQIASLEIILRHFTKYLVLLTLRMSSGWSILKLYH